MNDPTRPRVSVCIVSYNYRQYLVECIESVLNQQVNFPFEVIICDDASTDGATEIASSYARKYPDIVRLIARPTNVGPYKNIVDAHNLARGDYVAHLDADDYWLPGKLQQQFDFLEANPNYAVVWHRVNIVDEAGAQVGVCSIASAISLCGPFVIQHALELGSLGVHSACMFRTNARHTREPNFPVIDWFYTVEFLRHGLGHELPSVLGAYRVRRTSGMSHSYAGIYRTRRAYSKMLKHYIRLLPAHRELIFTNALIFLLIDLRSLQIGFLYLLSPLFRSLSFRAPTAYWKAIRNFRSISRAYNGSSPLNDATAPFIHQR